MTTQSSLLVLFLLLCSTTFLSHLATAQEFPGRGDGYKRIKDVKYYHVVDIANYAIEEHNRQTGQELQFVRIIRGYLDGRYYKLIILAKDHGRKQRYEAVVWEKLWDKLRELVSFKLLA
ncbi:hypothetical protein Taro_047719 [Colocasia esculenta]|uniref:Cystatin domain-containing protein n=1 Tax=Colocasia esculenta TaxID=4460 RepID=A0A843WTP5_COLES|nr:hypothetical protein [Colocasia esculenta]